MMEITAARSTDDDVQAPALHRAGDVMGRLSSFRPRLAHASLIVAGVVAVKSFQMSFAALHQLSIRNLVPPDLASNVPIAIDGLVIGSIIATASFRQWSVGWWYSTVLFVLSTMLSIAGNIQYAHEIGGGVVAMFIYAGMPLTMLFAVHLTLMLWQRGKQVAAELAAEHEATELGTTELGTTELGTTELGTTELGAAEHEAAELEADLEATEFAAESSPDAERSAEPIAARQPRLYPLESIGPGYSRGQTAGIGAQHRSAAPEAVERPRVSMTAAQM
ncbi:DUF2637 domain-containing protein [Nocardia sp. NPDC059228]|uniref:DUF2637 domain-containing protein n=1 Tax=Nocardia sp. NPDC059228 TaxID=3346777 RepID=UPI0036780D10